MFFRNMVEDFEFSWEDADFEDLSFDAIANLVI